MKWLSNSCGGYRQRIALLAGGLLPESERAELTAHLAKCEQCGSHYAELQRLVAPLSNWERRFESIQPSDKMRARWTAAVMTEAAPGKPEFGFSVGAIARRFWREVIWPSRRAWASMAALWVIMLGIHLKLSESVTIAKSSPSAVSSAMRQNFEDQREILAELNTPANLEPAEPPRRNDRRPRSEGVHRFGAC